MHNIKSVLEGRTEGVDKIETKGSCGFLSPFYSALLKWLNKPLQTCILSRGCLNDKVGPQG